MALTVTATQGFELHRYVARDEVLYVPGDPGVTYARNDAVYRVLGSAGKDGIIDQAGDSTANPIGIVTKGVVCPAAATAFPKPGTFDPAEISDANKTLIPVQSMVPAGTKVFKASILTFRDDTVITYTVATRAIAETTGNGADDRPNGGLLYIYAGPGAGEMNVVEDYDHTGGAAELLLITHRGFITAPTSASTYVVLAGEAAVNSGISQFGRCDSQDVNELEMDDGANDGDYIVYGSWDEIGRLLAIGQLPIINRTVLYGA